VGRAAPAWLRCLGGLVSRAGQHRKRRILTEPRIAARKLAQHKHRTPVGFDASRIHAIRTQAGIKFTESAHRRSDAVSRSVVPRFPRNPTR
jgi:hypothetical protein